PRPGRPAVPAEIRQLIRQMSVANPLWGAPRIHGELLKLGIDIGTHASIVGQRIQRAGCIEVRLVLGGLHHQYVRI
ncbi:MAG: hypothetical protein WCF62_13460, partial [Pseudolabrys sp.]